MKIYIGCGGCGKDTVAFLMPQNAYFVDDNKTGEFEGHTVIGTIDEFTRGDTIAKYSCVPHEIYNCIGSVGDNRIRNEVYEKITKAGFKISPLLLCSFLSKDVQVGSNVMAGVGSQLHHDCYIGDNSVISPGAVVLGSVKLEGNNFIGAGAVVIQGCKIGKNSIVGAGSVVLHDIEENSTYVGNPARKVKGVG